MGENSKSFDLCEDGNWYDTVEATTIDEALQIARDNVDAANYGTIERTTWIDVRARCAGTDEDARATVALQPEEPQCDGGDHQWESPHSVVGGLRENPGVHGHGGGVVCKEICRHCGVYRVTDTWAQDMSTGEQGLTSVEYRDADDDSETYVRAQRLSSAYDAIRAAGYDPSGASDDERIIVAVTHSDDDDALGEVRRIVEPLGCSAEWTGNSDTWGDGSETDDVRIEASL